MFPESTTKGTETIITGEVLMENEAIKIYDGNGVVIASW
jgi:hypothetical protein